MASGNSNKRDEDWDVFKALTKTVDKIVLKITARISSPVAQHPCLRCAFFALMRPSRTGRRGVPC